MSKSRMTPSQKQTIVEYKLSIHFGVCMGPVDALLGVYAGEKEAFTTRLSDPAYLQVTNADLFGGLKEEGGLAGTCTFLPGRADQLMPAALAAKFGRTPETMPGFRGITSLFFSEYIRDGALPTYDVGPGGYASFSPTPGFFWSANQPVIRDVWAKVTRVPRSWYPERAAISGMPITPRAVYLAIDNSGSMWNVGNTDNRMATVLEAMSKVYDRIAGAIEAFGLDLDLRVNFWSDTTRIKGYDNVSLTDLQAMRDWTNLVTIGGGTLYDQGVRDAQTWFAARAGDESISKRVLVFITDGETSAASLTAAKAITANMPDVEIYAINILLADTTSSGQLDNTPDDGVPVVSGTDSTGLITAIERALYPDDPGPDANPAHIIYECLTNTDWGMGAPRSSLDLVSFTGSRRHPVFRAVRRDHDLVAANDHRSVRR
jgi:hypothetical protein